MLNLIMYFIHSKIYSNYKEESIANNIIKLKNIFKECKSLNPSDRPDTRKILQDLAEITFDEERKINNLKIQVTKFDKFEIFTIFEGDD